MSADSTFEFAFDHYEPAEETRRESLLGLGNGVLFVRACAPEAAIARPHDRRHYPGLYLAGCYDEAERSINGHQVHIAALVNLPHALALDFRIGDDGPWFDLDAVGAVLHYRHRLDLARGCAEREVVARDAAGRTTRLVETRLVSMVQAHAVHLRWRVTPLDWSGPVCLRAQLATQACNAKVERSLGYEGRHLEVEPMPTKRGLALRACTHDGSRRLRIAATLRAAAPIERGAEPGALWQQCRLEARAGKVFSAELAVQVVDAADASGQEGGTDEAGFERALAGQRASWQALWRRVAIEVRADPALERCLRFNAFHLLQTASPLSAARDTGLPARGWQEAYFGHVFWDEVFAFPFYALRLPEVARGLLAYRARRLNAARLAARLAGRRGAMFPWRSAASGEEETPAYQWIPPARLWKRDHTRLQRHVGAAIAWNAWHYHLATADREWLLAHGGAQLIDIARFWASTVEPAGERYSIRGVIGPDEYHDAYPRAAAAGLDDNAYTNLMAAWTLRCAANLRQRLARDDWEQLSARCGLGAHEVEAWERIGRRIVVPWLAGDVIAQFAGADALEPVDARPLADHDPRQRIDWWLLAHGRSPNRYQVTKQADVLAAFHLLGRDAVQDLVGHLGYRCTSGWYERSLHHYLARISHESSLSRIVCAGALVGVDSAASWRYFRESLYTDFGPQASGGTHEGLHLGAMAGAWDVMQRGYLGLWLEPEGVRLDPRPPDALDGVQMLVRVRRRQLRLRLSGRHLRFTHLAGEPIEVALAGERRRLAAGAHVEVACR